MWSCPPSKRNTSNSTQRNFASDVVDFIHGAPSIKISRKAFHAQDSKDNISSKHHINEVSGCPILQSYLIALEFLRYCSLIQSVQLTIETPLEQNGEHEESRSMRTNLRVNTRHEITAKNKWFKRSKASPIEMSKLMLQSRQRFQRWQTTCQDQQKIPTLWTSLKHLKYCERSLTTCRNPAALHLHT